MYKTSFLDIQTFYNCKMSNYISLWSNSINYCKYKREH